jgi:hypothetical protein
VRWASVAGLRQRGRRRYTPSAIPIGLASRWYWRPATTLCGSWRRPPGSVSRSSRTISASSEGRASSPPWPMAAVTATGSVAATWMNFWGRSAGSKTLLARSCERADTATASPARDRHAWDGHDRRLRRLLLRLRCTDRADPCRDWLVVGETRRGVQCRSCGQRRVWHPGRAAIGSGRHPLWLSGSGATRLRRHARVVVSEHVRWLCRVLRRRMWTRRGARLLPHHPACRGPCPPGRSESRDRVADHPGRIRQSDLSPRNRHTDPVGWLASHDSN